MRDEFGDTFVEVVIELVDAIGVLLSDLFGIGHFSGERCLFEEGCAHAAAHISIFGNDLGHDISRSGVGFEAGIDAFFGIKVRPGIFFEDGFNRAFEFELLQDDVRECSQPFLARDAGAGFAFWTIGQVEVFNFLQRSSSQDGSGQFRGEFALGVYEPAHVGFAFVQGAQGRGPVSDGLDLYFIQAPGHFFAVPGNERDGVPLVEENDGAGYLPAVEVEFLAEGLRKFGYGQRLFRSGSLACFLFGGQMCFLLSSCDILRKIVSQIVKI